MEVAKGTDAAVLLSGAVREGSKQAWDALEEFQVEDDAGVYAFGDARAHVDSGRMQLSDGMGLRFRLNRGASGLGWEGEKWKPTSAPKICVEVMLSVRRRDVTVPELRQVSTVPAFTREGRLLNKNGFGEESSLDLDLQVAIDVPDDPASRDMRAGLRQL